MRAVPRTGALEAPLRKRRTLPLANSRTLLLYALMSASPCHHALSRRTGTRDNIGAALACILSASPYNSSAPLLLRRVCVGKVASSHQTWRGLLLRLASF